MNFEEKTKNQGTSQPEASQEEKVNGDMAGELVELDDVQLATVVGANIQFNYQNLSNFPSRWVGTRSRSLPRCWTTTDWWF